MENRRVGHTRITPAGVAIVAVFVIAVVLGFIAPRDIQGPAVLVAVLAVMAAGAAGVSRRGSLRGARGGRLSPHDLETRQAEFHAVNREGELRDTQNRRELAERELLLEREKERHQAKRERSWRRRRARRANG